MCTDFTFSSTGFGFLNSVSDGIITIYSLSRAKVKVVILVIMPGHTDTSQDAGKSEI